MRNPVVQRFTKNLHGVDYIVGDIHGCFSALEHELTRIGFNPEIDRLFAVGDLVDRGRDSDEVVEYLSKNWFHAVTGNHEYNCVLYHSGFGESWQMMENGAAWFVALTRAERAYYVDAFNCLPILIEIETDNGVVGLVHAEPLYSDWDHLKKQLSDLKIQDQVFPTCLWDRSRLDNMVEQRVRGIDNVVVGHSVVPGKFSLENVHYIDTGSGFRDGFLTIVNASTLDVM